MLHAGSSVLPIANKFLDVPLCDDDVIDFLYRATTCPPPKTAARAMILLSKALAKSKNAHSQRIHSACCLAKSGGTGIESCAGATKCSAAYIHS
jgi:hypothetical protein